jgi:S-adenosylmethionine-dependent methyltransferase
MSEVRRYYDDNAQREWERHVVRRIEHAVTMRVLDEHLPPPPATLLDVGGGPGRYAITLAGRGYRVTLADISLPELHLAREKAADAGVALSQIVEADARDLSRFADASFDAVLIMGPLYHLLEEPDRARAIAEAVRALRPGGPLFAAWITRYAALRFWARHDPARVTADRARYEAHLTTGRATNNFGFTDVYLARPEDVVPEMEAHGLKTVDLIGCEGVVSMIDDQINAVEGEDWDWWVDVNYRLGRDPSTHGTTEHLLYVGRKP